MKNKLADILIKYDLATADSLPVILYGLEYSFLLCINILTPVFILGLGGGLRSGMFFMFFFAIMRHYAGGFHAGNRSSCFILSQSMIIGIVWLSSRICIKAPFSLLLCLLFSLLIFIFAPKSSRYKPLSFPQFHKQKICSRSITVFYLSLSVLLFCLKYYSYYFIIMCVLGIQALLLLIPERGHGTCKK